MNKSIKIILILILSSNIFVEAQSFNKLYDFPASNYANSGFSMVKNRDLSFITLTYQGNVSSGMFSVFLTKYNSEGIINWSKKIMYVSDLHIGWAIYESYNGNYFIVGNTSVGSRVLKVNSSGELFWSKLVKSNNLLVLNSLSESLSGDLLLSGSDIYSFSPFLQEPIFLRMDTSGVVLDFKIIDDSTLTNSFGTDIIQLPDSSYMVTGEGRDLSAPQYQQYQSVFYKLDKKGDVKKGMVVNNNYNYQSPTFLNYNNGVIEFSRRTGYDYHDVPINHYGLKPNIIVLDTALNFINNQIYLRNTDNAFMLINSKGNYLIGFTAERTSIAEWDKQGNLLWVIEYGDDSFEMEVIDIVESDSGYVIMSTYLKDDIGKLHIMEVDKEGHQYCFEENLPFKSWLYDTIIDSIPDYYYLPVQAIDRLDSIVVTDVTSQTNFLDVTSTVVVEDICEDTRAIAEEIEHENITLKIYPNPTRGKFTIELKSSPSAYGISPKGRVSVKVYDVFGKIVYSTHQLKTKQLINLSQQAKGIYIVEITTDEYVYREKVVKN